MRAKIFVAGVSIAALLGAAACTTTDPYRSTPVRNNTGTGAIAGALGGALLGYLTNTSNGEQGRKNALIGAGVEGAQGFWLRLASHDDEILSAIQRHESLAAMRVALHHAQLERQATRLATKNADHQAAIRPGIQLRQVVKAHALQLDVLGQHPVARHAEIARALDAFPLGLAHGVRLVADVPADRSIRWSDVQVDRTGTAHRLRSELQRLGPTR